MTISIASEKDIPALDALVHICYRGQESLKGWTSEANLIDGTRTNPKKLMQDLASPNVTVLKYTDDQGELVGCISGVKQDDRMCTGMLCVRPDLQSKGLGKALMVAVDNLARQNKCNFVKIDVISVRDSLIAWYVRQGFQRIGEPVQFRDVAPTTDFGTPNVPLEFIEMEKPLF